MARKKVVKGEARAKMSELKEVASAFKSFRPAREVLTRVRAVPTRFVQFDHATRVGGFPIERFSLVHGKSAEGKTLFCLGLIDSFLTKGHFVLHVDAERTTPWTWVENLMGENASSNRFFAVRPESYEGTISDVQRFLNTVAELRAKEQVPPDTSALVIVDSLRKLVPRYLMKEILDAERDPKEVKGGRDRRAQIQAKMNAAWMDELVPLLEHANAGFVAIAREMADPDADQWARKYGTDYKVGGGSAIYYDASVVARIERESYVNNGAEGKDKIIYGERHRITIKKSKVGGKDGKVTSAHFHSSNGKLIPEGFDRARDVFELACTFGIIEKHGAWFSFDGERLGQGENKVVAALTGSTILAAVEEKTRAHFQVIEPIEFDEETGEVAS